MKPNDEDEIKIETLSPSRSPDSNSSAYGKLAAADDQNLNLPSSPTVQPVLNKTTNSSGSNSQFDATTAGLCFYFSKSFYFYTLD